MSRTKFAVLNTLFSTGGYFVQLIFSMAVRVLFIEYLGNEYLGLNGVYTSIISMLAISDLGLDSVFTFVLYKPISDKNESQIRALLRLYKKVYTGVSLIIFTLGVLFLPFLPVVLGDKAMRLDGVYVIYALYLLNSVISYLNAANRTLILANQKGYVVSIITTLGMILMNVGQLFLLLEDPNPIGYMIIQVAATGLINGLIFVTVRRVYPGIVKSKVLPVDVVSQKTKTTIVKNAVGGFSNKIGEVVVFGSDNVILSVFVSLTSVAQYSNYTVITSAVGRIASQIANAVVPSIGNLGVSESSDNSVDVFFELTFLMYFFSGIATAVFVSAIQPFIALWIGSAQMLSTSSTILISLSIWLAISRKPALIFIDAFGLQWVQRWKAVVESIVNIVLSLYFVIVMQLGIEGVLLGTVLSTILTVLWFEPYVVIKNVFKTFETSRLLVLAAKFVFLEAVIFFLAFGVIPQMTNNPILSIVTRTSVLTLVYLTGVAILFKKNATLLKLLGRFRVRTSWR